MSIKENGEVAHYNISKFREKRAKFWRPVGALRSATKSTVWPRDVVDRSSFRIASCSTSWAILIVKEFRKELSTLKEPVWIAQFLDRKFLGRKFNLRSQRHLLLLSRSWRVWGQWMLLINVPESYRMILCVSISMSHLIPNYWKDKLRKKTQLIWINRCFTQ